MHEGGNWKGGHVFFSSCTMYTIDSPIQPERERENPFDLLPKKEGLL